MEQQERFINGVHDITDKDKAMIRLYELKCQASRHYAEKLSENNSVLDRRANTFVFLKTAVIVTTIATLIYIWAR